MTSDCISEAVYTALGYEGTNLMSPYIWIARAVGASIGGYAFSDLPNEHDQQHCHCLGEHTIHHDLIDY
jgi:hypothetical protein